jgi:hypothetical protein
VERSIFTFCGTVHFHILWNGPFLHFVEQSIFTFGGTVHFYIWWNMMSGKVEESTLQASANTSLRNSTDGHIRKSIDYVNQAQDKDKPHNASSSWRPHVVEYKAMCFSIYGTERVPELMTMEKAYNLIFLQVHRPTRASSRKKKEDDLNPKVNTREACKFLFSGMIHCFILWNTPLGENYPLLSNVTDTTIHSNTGIRDPYADEVNENWPFLKNNFE